MTDKQKYKDAIICVIYGLLLFLLCFECLKNSTDDIDVLVSFGIMFLSAFFLAKGDSKFEEIKNHKNELY